MPDPKEQDCVQIITYIRRRRDLTPQQFYDHWENIHARKVVPWAEKHGIQRYQQIHVNGFMVPIASASSAPNALSTGALPTTPIEFDGIAMFLVPSLKRFTDGFLDPYYIEVIEPDERNFLDKVGPGSGVVASFQGKMIDIMLEDDNLVVKSGKDDTYRKLFEQYEKRGRAG